MFDTPILYLVFNRPDLVKTTFSQICKVKPKQLYIAADGPRYNVQGEQDKCQQCREFVLSQVDWDCEIYTLFRKENLGCKIAVSSAIDWFFSKVEMGIILEDDILPNQDFFFFTQDLLNRYRFEQNVQMISGLNVHVKWKEDKQDYHFCRFAGIWGWASWKRAWQTYDVNIEKWNLDNVKRSVLQNFPDDIKSGRRKMYDALYNNKIDTWDLQWTFAKLLSGGINIVPSKNLIKNIGCNSSGTHINGYHPWATLDTFQLEFPLRQPNVIRSDIEYDLFHLSFEKSNGKKNKKKNSSLLRKFISKADQILNR